MSDFSSLPIYYAPSDLPNCIVCGAANGTCTGESGFDHMIVLDKEKPDPRATFIVPERVFEETQVGSRLIRKLLYPKGARITPEEAYRCGFIHRAPQAN